MTLAKWERRADAALGIASAALLVTLMMITVADVVLRYLFAAPLRGAFELTEVMLLVLIFAGLPLVSRADEHVTMDFVDRILPAGGRRAAIRIVHAFTAAAMGLLAWAVWLKADKIAAYADTTETLKIAVAPFVYFMAVMCAATGAVHVWKLFAPIPASGSPAAKVLQ